MITHRGRRTWKRQWLRRVGEPPPPWHQLEASVSEHPRQAQPRRASRPSGASAGPTRAPTGSTAPSPATRCSPSTRRRPPCRARCTWARLLVHPHRLRRPLPAHAGPRGLLPDGLGRQRPQRRAPGPAPHRHPLRPVAALRPRLPAAREGVARRTSRSPSAGPTSSSCAARSSSSSRRPTSTCGPTSACRSTGTTATAPSAPRRRASQRGFLRLLARDLAYRSEAPTLWDVDFRTAVAQAELEDREIPGAYHKLRFRGPRRRGPVDRHHPPRAAAGLRGPRRPPRRRALPAAVRARRRTHAAVRRRGPDRRPRAGRPRQGHRHRHDLHLRRHHRRHVVARARPRAAARGPARRPAAPGHLGRPRVGVGRRRPPPRPPTTSWPAARSSRRRPASSSCWPRPGLIEGEPRPITHPVKFWENGTRPLEIVTSNQWFIRYPDKDAMLARGKELAWWPDFMRVRYENWVNGLQGDWNITRQRFFGVPFPAWYPIDADGRGRLPVAHPGRRGRRCRSTRPPTVPPGLRRRPARPAGRLHGRPRRDGHLGHVVAVAPDRHRLGRRPRPVRAHVPHGPAAPGPRHHPDLALLHGRPLALRARRPAVGQRRHLGLHRRPRPQEAVEVGGQRPRRPRRR